MHPDTDLDDKAAILIEHALDKKGFRDTDEIRAYSQEILNQFSSVFRLSPLLREVAAGRAYRMLGYYNAGSPWLSASPNPANSHPATLEVQVTIGALVDSG